MMSNLCTPGGLLPLLPEKMGANFFTSLGSEAWSKLFLAIGPEKEYPKLVSKFWGSPKNLQKGSKLVPNFVIFRLFCPFLHNGVRYHQSENGLLNYGNFPTISWKNGVLWSTMKYIIAAHLHPPCNLVSSLFTKLLDRWRHVGGGIPIGWSSIELIF